MKRIYSLLVQVKFPAVLCKVAGLFSKDVFNIRTSLAVEKPMTMQFLIPLCKLFGDELDKTNVCMVL